MKMDFSVRCSPLKTIVSRKVISLFHILAVDFIFVMGFVSFFKDGAHYCYCAHFLHTFSAHANVVAHDTKEMRNTQDTRTGFVSCKSGRLELFLVEKLRRLSTDEK